MGMYVVWLSPAGCGGFTGVSRDVEMCSGFPPPQAGVVLECLFPKCLLPKCLFPKCLLPKCLLCQNVYSHYVYCAKMSIPTMSTFSAMGRMELWTILSPGTKRRLYLRNFLLFHFIVCLFWLRLYVPVNNFSVMSGHFPGLNQY